LPNIIISSDEINIHNGLFLYKNINILDFGFVFYRYPLYSQTNANINSQQNLLHTKTKYFGISHLLEKHLKKNIPNRAIVKGSYFDKDKKIEQSLIFSEYKIPHIETYITKDATYLADLIKEKKRSFPLIAKPYSDSQGFGVTKINNLQDFEAFIRLYNYQVLVQPYIKNDGDYRVYIVKGEILGIIKRTSNDTSEFRNNISTGAKATNADLPDKVKAWCLNIAKIMNLDVSGVDVIQDLDSGEFFILEINSNPGHVGFFEATNINPMEEIVKHIKNIIL